MAKMSHFFVKAQPQIFGRWSTNGFWDKFAQAKKTVKDAYQRAISKVVPEAQAEPVASAELIHTISRQSTFQRILLSYRVNLQGLARVQQRMLLRPSVWGHGMRYFGRDFLLRRMRTGHLVGFATLFLVHEERMTEEEGVRKRMETYVNLCENIKEMFVSEEIDKGNIPESSKLGKNMAGYDLGECIAVGSNGAVYEAEIVERDPSKQISPGVLKKPLTAGRKRHPKITKKKRRRKVAIKMVYNLNSSNAGVICSQTKAELVTCGRGAIVGLAKDWQNGSRARMKTLPRHSNVIRVQRAMIDGVPHHPQFAEMHPATLPSPVGFGRSSAMFLVMKKYDCTLAELLKNPLPSSVKSVLSLQLLQGISHLERNCIAHRDLKSNNILIERDSAGLPRLVISDFGCAFVPEGNENLTFPFLSPIYDIRNGNPEVQPPEITNSHPGPDSVLDYSKADAWAAGILLSEIMGIQKNKIQVESRNESAELVFFKRLIRMLMNEDPAKRMSCTEAARVLHLQLFGPNFKEVDAKGMTVPSRTAERTIQDWLLLHASETFAYRSTTWGKNSVVCEIFTNFFSTLSHASLSSAFISWRSLSV